MKVKLKAQNISIIVRIYILFIIFLPIFIYEVNRTNTHLRNWKKSKMQEAQKRRPLSSREYNCTVPTTTGTTVVATSRGK